MSSDEDAEYEAKLHYEKALIDLIRSCVWSDEDTKCGVLLVGDTSTGNLGVIAINSDSDQVDTLIRAAAEGIAERPKNEKEWH